MRSCRPRTLTTVVAVAGALFTAGCGGGGSPGVASVTSSTTTATTTTTTTTTTNALVAFSRCMRSNGVPNFPDPQLLVGGNLKLTIHQLATTTPQVKAAMSACNHLLPNSGSAAQETAQQTRTQIAALLAFARCLRSHGFPSFPDPSGSGQLTHQMLATAGIDLHQPAVVQAADVCTSVTHGVITKAVVASFVAGR
jgi:hypothetical protein